MRYALAFLLAFAAVPASAESFDFQRNGMTYSIVVPAAKWFAEPLLAEPKILPENSEIVQAFCTERAGKPEGDACTTIDPGFMCSIVINRNLPPRMYAAVLHHELAHCHGWPADHPTD